MLYERVGLVRSSSARKARSGTRSLPAHLGNRRLRGLRQRDDDQPAVTGVVFTLDEIGPGKLADDQARMRGREVETVRQLGDRGRS